LQQQGRCDCKKRHAQCFVFAITFLCVIANIDGNFYDCKKRSELVCGCNYIVTKTVVACSSLAFSIIACSAAATFKASPAASFFFCSSAAAFSSLPQQAFA
jgi:hypothetical protein